MLMYIFTYIIHNKIQTDIKMISRQLEEDYCILSFINSRGYYGNGIFKVYLYAL